MITVKQVATKKEQKEFLNFPLKLYKGNPYFVPPLMMDEKKIFKPDYVYNETCDVVFYNAYMDGKMVGRISGIIQRAANEKWKQNRVRFTRFDCVDDFDVAKALFDAVTAWAKEKGITEIVGPLGYSDLEREGLLIEGFDQFSTYEEQYNYSYYQTLIEKYGFRKEVDWLEFKLYLPEKRDEKFHRVAKMLLEKNELTMVRPKSISSFLDQYKDQFFEILDVTYKNIYGTVPFTKKMMDTMISGFKLLVRTDNVTTLVDKNGKVVGFALCFPSISKAVNKSKGRITLPFIFRFLKAKMHPKVLDLGLIGVLPEYEPKGVAAIMIEALQDLFIGKGIDHLETNLVLENNYHSLNMHKRFTSEFSKKRRCFIKEIQ